MKSALASGFAAAKVSEFVVPRNTAHFSRQPPLLPLQRRSGMRLSARRPGSKQITQFTLHQWFAKGYPGVVSEDWRGGVQMFDKKCL